jgi:signal transduction histidine kinase/HD-like signal output (HDOD) protein
VNGCPEQIDPADGKLSLQQLDLLLRRLDRLPTPPAVASRIIELSSQSEKAQADSDIVQLITCDPALTAHLLRHANRSAPNSAHTVEQAAALLDSQDLRTIALSVNPARCERSNETAAAFDFEGFWRHCLGVAVAMEMLTETLSLPIDPKEAFTCGLLHDLGKVALWWIVPKSYARVLEVTSAHDGNLSEHERKVIGVDHCVAGRRLAQQWQLGEVIQQVAWMHHQTIDAIPDSLSDCKLIIAVSLCDTIARRERLGFSGNNYFTHSQQEFAAELHLPERDMESLIEALDERIEQQIEQLDLPQLNGDVLHREVLADANVELQHTNERLILQVKQTDAEVNAFRCLRDFAAGLSDSSTVSDALTGIARVLRAIGLPGDSSQPVVVYAIDENTRQLIALRSRDPNNPEWLTFRCEKLRDLRKTEPPHSTAEVLSIFSDGAQEFAEWIDPAAQHYPLCCADRWVGGVLHQSEANTRPQMQGLFEALSGALGMSLGIIQNRERAITLGEQLAGASQSIAETHQALTEAKVVAAVGEMAAGAAHEMNTPLAVVSGRAQVMAENATNEDERSAWRIIAAQAQRISDTITELMTYAHPPAPNPESCDVGELLAAARELFSRSDHPQAKSAYVDIKLDPALPPVSADRKQIEEAVAELIMNAATAGGSEAPIVLTGSSEIADDAVVVSVSDSGPGMDAPTLAKAFTPFFSSQKAGRRRGMGLARVKRCVENGGGRIWIRSSPGEGTSVFLQLPTADVEQ